jgi:hypothetical protein
LDARSSLSHVVGDRTLDSGGSNRSSILVASRPTPTPAAVVGQKCRLAELRSEVLKVEPERKSARGSKSEIRAYFYSGEVPRGPRHYNAVLEVSNDLAIVEAPAERFGLEDAAKWPHEVFDLNSSPVDLSFLNQPEKPAGKHGFLKRSMTISNSRMGHPCASGARTSRLILYSRHLLIMLNGRPGDYRNLVLT